MFVGRNRAQVERIAEGVLEALIKASIVEGTDGEKTAVIDPAATGEAMLMLLGCFVAHTAPCATPSGRRKLTEEAGKVLLRRINEAREEMGSNFVFETMQ